MSLRRARRAAEMLAEELEFKEPAVDVELVARHLGVPIVYADLGEGISGLLVTENRNATICVNKSDAHVRQRFTIAHELGHYVLRHQFVPGEAVHVDKGHFISQRGPLAAAGVDPKEIAANQFAAALLIPRYLIEKIIRELPDSSLLDYQVQSLAQRFQVSEQAMTIRLSTLGML